MNNISHLNFYSVPRDFKGHYYKKVINGEKMKVTGYEVKWSRCSQHPTYLEEVSFSKIQYYIKEKTNKKIICGFQIHIYYGGHNLFKYYLEELNVKYLTLYLFNDVLELPTRRSGSLINDKYKDKYKVAIDILIESIIKNNKIKYVHIFGFSKSFINEKLIKEMKYNKTLLEFKYNDECVFNRKKPKILSSFNDVEFLFYS